MFDTTDGACLHAAADDFACLETKGEEPASLAAMGSLLTRMRNELDQQFETFVTLRDTAMQRAMSEDLPEAEAKLARADLKAAVDALSMTVRTLEKVDQLERQLARDRAELEAQPESREAYDALFGDVEAMIEARVEERLEARLKERLAAMAAAPPGADGPQGRDPQETAGEETGGGDAASP